MLLSVNESLNNGLQAKEVFFSILGSYRSILQEVCIL